MNSMKMKMSVIFGVAHMALGVFQKAFNAIHFRKREDFLHEFIPQIIMLLSLFGYMDLLIIIKWNTNYLGIEHEAPSIISTVVGMFLSGGKVPGKELFPGQVLVNNLMVGKSTISIMLTATLVIFIVCIPWMLLVKPYLLWKGHKHGEEERERRGGDVELAEYQVFNDEPVRVGSAN